MPTNPVRPNTEAAIDRLTLGVDSPRGTAPSCIPGACYACNCFEIETSGTYTAVPCACVEAEASSVLYGQSQGTCFESE